VAKPSAKPVSFRLDAAALDRLTLAAVRANVSPGELARNWVLERLDGDRPDAPPAGTGIDLAALRRELARAVFVVLAGVSPDLDEAAAADLVRTYFLGTGSAEVGL
jgi:hypothetical protein